MNRIALVCMQLVLLAAPVSMSASSAPVPGPDPDGLSEQRRQEIWSHYRALRDDESWKEDCKACKDDCSQDFQIDCNLDAENPQMHVACEALYRKCLKRCDDTRCG